MQQKKYKIYILLSILILILFLTGLGTEYMLGTKQQKHPARIPVKPSLTPFPSTTPVSSTPTDIPTRVSFPIQTTSQVQSIPKDWKSFTATDPDFGVTATMSLPPGYSFFFSGSEFTIQNSEATEVWDYTTSVFNGNDGLKNYYDGGSRRLWYQKYISGDIFGNVAKSDAKIISVDESNSAYLKITVSTSGIPNQIAYIAIKNGITNIFRYGNNQNLAQYMQTIVQSLTVSKIK